MLLKNWFKSLADSNFSRRAAQKKSRHRRSAQAVSRIAQSLEQRNLLAATNPLPLANLNGTNGFKIDGIDQQDASGRSVSGAGDVNGDGFEDIVIGAPPASGGEAYVVFGKSGGFGATLALSALNGSNGFVITGAATGDELGTSVSHADVNGDGLSDVILGAKFADAGGDANSGQAYVVFGKTSAFSASLSLGTLNGSNGFRMDGIDVNDYAGASVSGAGDINGDGFDDVLVGAYAATGGAVTENGGEVYVVFGRSGGFSATLNLASLNGTTGFRIDGAADYDTAGISVSAAGDFNGDGFDDVIIGAQTAQTGTAYSGAAYVVFGKSSAFSSALSLNNISGANGFRIAGTTAYSYFGGSVSGLGDVNGDGFDDVAIGARQTAGTTTSDSYVGAAYVVFGSSSAVTSVSGLNGNNGFRFNGTSRFDYAGIAVRGAGDVNGDGFDDVMIGATENSPYGAGTGEAYVLFGKSSAFSATLNRASLNGTTGFRLDGEATYDQVGQALGHADVNGDGFEDVILGAYGVSVGAVTDAGRTYVVFGGNFTGGAETKVGGSGANTLTADRGGSAVDRLIGGLGNDTLNADGGADVLIGGEGADRLSVVASNFGPRTRIDGGSGTDTLALRSDVSGATLNLTTIPVNRIIDIEEIDINGNGANTLVVNVNSVLQISNTSNTLTVRRGSDDTVTVNGFGTPVTQTISGADFDVYTQGAATLRVQKPAGQPTSDAPVIAETGTVTFSQGNANGFQTVTLTRTYANPVVIATPPSFGDQAPVTVRLKDVTSNSFKIQLDEWDYLDGAHGQETIGYIVIEAGSYLLPDGTILQAGTVDASHRFGNGSLTGFREAPVLLTQIQTRTGGSAVVTRVTDLTSSGFRVRVQEEQAADGGHSVEKIGFLAIEAGTGNSGVKFQAGTASLNDAFGTVNFTQTFTQSPVFLAATQTSVGADPISLRYRGLGVSSVRVKLEEEQSFDQETAHGAETVGYLAIGSGLLRGYRAQAVAETGTVSVVQPDATTFQRVTFTRSFTNPVVIATPPSFAGSAPVTVSLRNVTSTGFDIQIDEWDYLDGAHAREDVGYIVVEAGTTILADGTVIEAGIVNTGEQFAAVSLSGFSTTPVILTQSQSTNGGAAIVTRQRNASATGFQVRVQEEQAADDVHAAEQIGYIAISAGTGESGLRYESGFAGGVNHNFTAVSFTQTFSSAPVFLGAFQTADGGDVVAMRSRELTSTGVRIKAEEEQSFDTEVSHGPEQAAFLAIEAGVLLGRAPTVIAETGSISFSQDTANVTRRVNLRRSFQNPVVIAQPPSFNGTDPVTVRVSNVTSTSFDLRLQEWDYQDGIHGQETVGYIVVEAGTYRLADGSLLHAGTSDVGSSFADIDLSSAGFTAAPVVLSQSQTVNGGSAITTRQQNVTGNGFQVRVQEEQNGDDIHAAETVGFVAIAAGSGTSGVAFQAGRVDSVNNNFSSRSFSQTFGVTPIVLASMQTTNGADPASLRVNNVSTSGFQVLVEEEQSADAETNHGAEVVGFLSAVEGLITGEAV